MLIYRIKPRVSRKPKMKIMIGTANINHGETSSHPGTSYRRENELEQDAKERAVK
jgi:hypothetical protein